MLRKKLLLYAVLLMQCRICYMYWWLYSRVLSIENRWTNGDEAICHHYHLNDHQLKECLRNPNILLVVGRGANEGLEVCQKQFVTDRWNCPNDSFNSKLYKKRTPESAYVNAISCAGVTSRLIEQCDRGTLPDCGCQGTAHEFNTVLKLDREGQPFYWSECNSHIKFGLRTARMFLDPTRAETFVDRSKKSMKKLVIVQNNRAARKVLLSMSALHKRCSCHGTSGQCIVRTCYRWLPPLNAIATNLYSKYNTAVEVKLENNKKLVSVDPDYVLKKTDLVYTERYTYCNHVEGLGVPGTKDRACLNRKPTSTDDMRSCRIFCCDRGYYPARKTVRVPCRCLFKWCCDVTCDECIDEVIEYRCR